MPFVRWTLTDPATSNSLEFETNPSEHDTPGFEKNLQYTNTAAPDGKVLVFEGRDKPRRGSLSGTVYTEEALAALRDWWDKRNQITLTDDLGQTTSIIIETLQFSRRRARHHVWIHDYELSYLIVDWPTA